jgi:hypothetical protein
MTLSGDQFSLPGMESMSRAEPHEQTESQFHNRPDVFVHGRYEPLKPGPRELVFNEDEANSSKGFHAGTETSSHERMSALGTPWAGTSPKFYHGSVDVTRMNNNSTPGAWETGSFRQYDRGRAQDEGQGWTPEDHGKYYRNDYEDVGSTSAVLPFEKHLDHGEHFGEHTPGNFLTHRQAVSDALSQGKTVPGHVKAVYDATGGSYGPKSVVHPDFKAPQSMARDKYSRADYSIPGVDGHFNGNLDLKPPF